MVRECFEELITGLGWQSHVRVCFPSHNSISSYSLPLQCCRLEHACRQFVEDSVRSKSSSNSESTSSSSNVATAGLKVRCCVSPIRSLDDESSQQSQARALALGCITLMLECACKWLAFALTPFVLNGDDDSSRPQELNTTPETARLGPSERETLGQIPLFLVPSSLLLLHKSASRSKLSTQIRSNKRQISSANSPLYDSFKQCF